MCLMLSGMRSIQLCCRYYDAAAYAAFRDCSLAESAAAHAAEGEVERIEKLLSHHPVTVMPRLLEVLDSLPETLPPREYLHLLPKVCSGVHCKADFSTPRCPAWLMLDQDSYPTSCFINPLKSLPVSRVH